MDDLKTLVCIHPAVKVTEKPEILFARLDVKEVMKKVEALQEARRSAAQAEASGEEEEKKDDEAVIDIGGETGNHIRRFFQDAVPGG